MSFQRFCVLILVSIALFSNPLSAQANVPSLNADRVHTSAGQKLNFYIREGLFAGGDRTIEDVVVLDIRFAKNQGYERLVLDLEGNHKGDLGALKKPPYYQVSVTPDMKRLTVTLFGKPRLSIDPKRIHTAFRKSQNVSSLELLPLLEKDRWSFIVNLAQEQPVEVFELSNPIRIIVDIKNKK